MIIVIVSEDFMNRDSHTVYCPECNAPIEISTRMRKCDKEANPIYCPECNAVLVIKGETADGEVDLNLSWAGMESDFEREILYMLKASSYPTKQLSQRFKAAIKTYGKDAVRAASKSIINQHEGKPITGYLLGDIIRFVEKRNAPAKPVTQTQPTQTTGDYSFVEYPS